MNGNSETSETVMKNLLAATAIILAIAAPAAAQSSSASSANPNISDRPDLRDDMYGEGTIDYGTTRSIGPVDRDIESSGVANSSPLSEDTADSANRAVGGRSN